MLDSRNVSKSVALPVFRIRDLLTGSGSLDPYTELRIRLRILLFYSSGFKDANKNEFSWF
jgi:hypothetical protein